jgi:tetraacyldisaccharide 4'-kinase
MSQASSARPILLPLVPLYRLALALRELRLRWGLEPVRRLRYPVVSIGNLSAGGAGKTPLTIALAKLLIGKGFHVDALSRGYGRQSRLPARVRPDGTAAEFGDEPLLIARQAGVPVYVAPQRYDAGLLAEADVLAQGMSDVHSVHLLDDGFQHHQLGRDVDILLLNLSDWRDRLLPAGNLREPLRALHRANVIAIPATESELETELRARGWQGPIWRLHRGIDVPAVDGPIAAFCGIARSGQFFQGLESTGLRLAARIAFPDHHPYTSADLERVLAAARRAGATSILTTEKDSARLGNLASVFSESLPLLTAGLRIEIEEESAAIDWLIVHLDHAPMRLPV